MKILVPIKRVIDHTLRIRLITNANSGETLVDSNNMKMVMNPFDEISVEEAVRWRENGQASEVIAVSIGGAPCADTIRTALAMGVDRGIHIKTNQILEPLAVAKCLHTLVIQESPQLVFMGKQAVDDDYCQTGQILASLLGWAQATFASKITLDADNTLKVNREIDGGEEVIRIMLPAIITADLLLNTPRYASLPNIMKARKKPLQEIALDDLAVDIAPRLTTVKLSEPPQENQDVMSILYLSYWNVLVKKRCFK